ncbi:hypothetical protein Q0Z83_030170 [Actinoplanes sichuanensis]|nr:hypothetical protein Q0Z83_030170 [Actinoplanes sichuanensis]
MFGPGAGQGRPEHPGVDGVLTRPDDVAAVGEGDQRGPFRIEAAPQRTDEPLNDIDAVRRRVAVPQGGHDLVERHRPGRV